MQHQQFVVPCLRKTERARVFIFIGLIANTCIETSARDAAELGYHVTLVSDATAAMSADAMHAAHEINGPTFAHAIIATTELVQKLAAEDAA